MIPSARDFGVVNVEVYQRGLVIDSQLTVIEDRGRVSVSKGIGD